MTGKVHMWMWFHTAVGDRALFESWTITDGGTMAWSCAVVILWGIVLEMVRWLRWVVKNGHGLSPTWYGHLLSKNHWLDTFLFAVQTVLSMMLMLFFMTYSLWLCISCSLGVSLGCWFFGARKYISL